MNPSEDERRFCVFIGAAILLAGSQSGGNTYLGQSRMDEAIAAANLLAEKVLGPVLGPVEERA